jgi:hypothetical protein
MPALLQYYDLQAAVDRLAADGYGLVGGIGQYEHVWRMPYMRGPEGIIVPWPSGSADSSSASPTGSRFRY